MVVWSALLHAGALGLVLVSPSIRDREPPHVIAVELVTPAPPAPAAKPAPAPAPPVPAPPPEVVPAPPPPPPEPKAIVLPEKQTAPKPKDKPKPKPKPEKEVFKEPPKKQEKSLDDLLAEMRDSEPKAAPAPAAPVDTAVAAPIGTPSEGSGELSPEEAAWRTRVIRKMKGVWAVQPGFRMQQIETRVVVTLDAAGNIIGEPRITKKSGNPWYDEGVIRGLKKSNPLPPPPEAGDWPLWFRPEDSL